MSDRAPLGAADCEAIGAGLLAQPVNALTSLAYIAAGVRLLLRSGGLPRSVRWRPRAYGAALIAVGVGSFAYHGPGGELSRVAHDASIAGLLVVLPVDELARRLGWGPRRAAAAWGGAVMPASALIAAVPAATGAVAATVGGVALAGELDRWRDGGLEVAAGRRPAARGSQAVAAVAITAGLAAYWFGRTGSPLCSPDSLLQLHGVWHVLGAVAAGAWGERALVETAVR